MSQLKWILAAVLIVSLAGVAWGQIMPPDNQTTDNLTPIMENVTPTMGVNVTPTMEGNVTPSINVTMNQTITGNETIANVTIDEVVSDGPGWIVVHNSLFGTLGGAIGFSPVEDGMNSNVTVMIDTLATTDQLIAELHMDLGEEGVFEYPAIDLPQMIDGEPVSANFSITADNFTVKNLTELAGNQTQIPEPGETPGSAPAPGVNDSGVVPIVTPIVTPVVDENTTTPAATIPAVVGPEAPDEAA